MNQKGGKKTTSLKKIMGDIKKTDPTRYKEIEDNVKERVDELKKHGGARLGAGRKKIFKDRVKITKEIPKESVEALKAYAKEKNISENEALHTMIMCSYNSFRKVLDKKLPNKKPTTKT